jgi:hypothetical protein
MNVLADMIKVPLGRLNAGVAEVLLKPIDAPPNLQPTDRKCVPEIVDTESGEARTVHGFCGDHTPHSLVEVCGHLDVWPAIRIEK